LSILQGKSGTKIRDTFVFFQKLPKFNNRPLGENPPNLVTLPGTDVMIFKKIAEKFTFLTQTNGNFAEKVIICNIGFLEKRHFFHRKLAKIAKNCEHSIDPCISTKCWRTC
jgi:hypothetical protein